MSVDTTIGLSEAAAQRIAKLLDMEGDQSLRFRVYITGGGCSGFQYGFAFERDLQEDDVLIHKEVDFQGNPVAFDMVVDSMSYQYLQGAQVEYEEGLYGAHFKVSNPNASNTCGCGNSFSLS